MKPLLAFLLSALLILAACGPGKDTAATVNGIRIAKAEINDMIKRYAAINRKLNPAYTEPTGLLLENQRRQFLDGLIERALILDKAKTLGISVTDSEVNAKIGELKKSNDIMDAAAFSRYLTEQGISETAFRSNIRDIMLMEKTRDRFFEGITATDSEAAAYYKANAARFARETMRAAQIFLALSDKSEAGVAKVRKKAESLAAEARAGKDFAALAKRHSQDPGSKNGGDLGEVARGDMAPEFDAALFALKQGGVAGPIESKHGFHLFKALSDPRKGVQSLESVRAAIDRQLMAEKRMAKFKSLRENAKIKVLWDFKG